MNQIRYALFSQRTTVPPSGGSRSRDSCCTGSRSHCRSTGYRRAAIVRRTGPVVAVRTWTVRLPL
jgi:hypothetical protein